MTGHLKDKAKVFKALGHPGRLAIVEALCEGELCVCDIVPVVGRDISTVSKHLSILKEAGILKDSKRGTNVYYSLSMECVPVFFSCLDKFFIDRFNRQAGTFFKTPLKRL